MSEVVIVRKRRAADLTLVGVLACVASLTGCSSAPSQSILGSYFPSWMLCALGGLGCALVLRHLLVMTSIDKVLPIPLVVYLSFAVAFAFVIWLAWLE